MSKNSESFGFIRDVQPHDHMCLIYENADEWQATAIPYVITGLINGDRCLYIADAHTPDQIRKHLWEQGVDVVSAEIAGRIRIVSHHRSFTDLGYFEPDRMIDYLIREAENARDDHFKMLRITGEMSWMSRGYTGWRRVPEFEARLNQEFFPKYSCAALCQYERAKTDSDILKSVLMTHPQIIRKEKIFDSMYYIQPEDYLGLKRSDHEVQLWLTNIEREQESQQRMRFLADVVENASQAFCAFYPDGRMITYNRAFDELTRMKLDLAAMMPAGFTEMKKRKADREKAWTIEFDLSQDDGSSRAILATVFQVFDHYGKTRHLYAFFNDLTEHRRMEINQRQQAVFLQKLIDTIPNPIYYKDTNGFYQGCNTAFEKLVGMRREKILGSTLSEVVTPDMVDFFVTMDQQLIESQGVQSFETNLPLCKGDRPDVLFNKAVYFNAEGYPAGLVGIILDITHRKQTEMMLEMERRRLFSVMDELPASIHIMGPDREIRFANRFFRDRFGSPDGRHCYEIFLGRSEPCTPCMAMDVLKRKATLEFEIMVNGRTYQMSQYFLQDVDQSPQVMSLGIDITGRKLAEENLRISDEIFKNLSAGIIITTASSDVISMNPAFTEMTGYTKDDFNGKSLMQVNNAFWEGIYPEDIVKVLESQGWWRGEIMIPRKNGEAFPAELSVHTIAPARRRPVRYYCVIKDITEQIKMNTERQRLQEQTAKAQRMASLSTMSAGIVHEIAQPLNTIKLLADGILFWQEQGNDIRLSEAIQSLKDISLEVDQVDKIIKHMRSFADIGSSTECVACDVNKAVLQALSVVGRQISTHGITVEHELAPGLPPVSGVEKGIEEALINLLVNAMNAHDRSEKPNKTIRCRTCCHKDIIRVEVIDNATGIPEEIQGRLFEPLFSTAAGSQGMGLGLSIVQAVVDRCGGRICFHNNDEGGATFTIELERA